eukprot:scaffold56167_cov63-Phaeocystis_antarctica.AAC.2
MIRIDHAYEAGQCVRLVPPDALAPDEDVRHRRAAEHQRELGVQRSHLVEVDARVPDPSRVEGGARLGGEAALAPREDDHGRRAALADEPARREHLTNLRPHLVALVLRGAARRPEVRVHAFRLPTRRARRRRVARKAARHELRGAGVACRRRRDCDDPTWVAATDAKLQAQLYRACVRPERLPQLRVKPARMLGAQPGLHLHRLDQCRHRLTSGGGHAGRRHVVLCQLGDRVVGVQSCGDTADLQPAAARGFIASITRKQCCLRIAGSGCVRDVAQQLPPRTRRHGCRSGRNGWQLQRSHHEQRPKRHGRAAPHRTR